MSRTPAGPPAELWLHFLLFVEDGRWVAHCLDFDVAADGASEDEARQSLVHAIELLIEEATEAEDSRCHFQSAPRELWDLYVKSDPDRLRGRTIRLETRVPTGRAKGPRPVHVEQRVRGPA